MDVCEEGREARHRKAPGETIRAPLVSSDKHYDNGVVSARSRPRTREVSSRYRSPTPSAPRRCPSPNTTTRTPTTPTSSLPKRSLSAERKRPSPPSSPRNPSTPVQDSSINGQLLSRRLSTGRIPEGLWPSTMRSLTVSFQSDSISIPVSSRREKSVASTLSDRTLKPSSNVAHKQAEPPGVLRKPTPERKRSPLKGKNVSDLSENSKPIDALNSRLVEQHRWPSRTGGKISSNMLARSVDFSDRNVRTPTLAPSSGIGVSLRRMPISDDVSKTLQKSSSDTLRLASPDDIGRVQPHSIDINSLRISGPSRLTSSSLSERMTSTTPTARSSSLPTPGSRPSSPSRTSALSVTLSRGSSSPSRSRPSTPALSRGASPSRSRPSSPSRQATNTTSVLSFIADVRKGKKGANHIEDAHQLKLLHNRYLQWRFANAQAEGSLYVQIVLAEKHLCDVWGTLLELWDSVKNKRITLQQQRLKLKLDIVLSKQLTYLDDWALIEREHSSSLSGAIQDLMASTLRLPVTAGARADIEIVKVAICSAVDVMQTIGTSICTLFSKLEGMNYVVSELANLAAYGRALLDECETLLASTEAMQVEEYSLKTHLMQLKQDLKEG